jgi:hypothetical protein
MLQGITECSYNISEKFRMYIIFFEIFQGKIIGI